MSLYGKFARKYYYTVLFTGCFCGGALIEIVMIKFRFGDTNFYDTFKKNEAKRAAEKLVEIDQRLW